jgi:hypothetical protein
VKRVLPGISLHRHMKRAIVAVKVSEDSHPESADGITAGFSGVTNLRGGSQAMGGTVRGGVVTITRGITRGRFVGRAHSAGRSLKITSDH